MDNFEIEIRVKVQKSTNLRSFLKKNGKLLSEKHQIDQYFTPAHRNFVKVRPIKEWLRLRKSNNKHSITYKNWYYGKNGKSLSYCDEYETSLGDLEQFKKLLKAIGFEPLITVDKKRETWSYKDYEISLDSVKGLGDFVEIEFIGKVKKLKPEKITKEMVGFLKSHKCGKIERDYVGYAFQLLFPKEVQFEVQ